MRAAAIAVVLVVTGLLAWSYWPAPKIQEGPVWTVEDFQRVYSSWKYYKDQISAIDVKGPLDPGDAPMRGAYERERVKTAADYNREMARVGYSSAHKKVGLPERLE